MNKKIIVAHPERQHSFKTSSALKRSGMLCKYVTTVYNKDSSLLMKFTKIFLSEENLQRANNRINPDLTDDDVVQFCEIRGLLQIALYRFDKSKVIYNWWHKKTSQKFGKKVAKLAIKENADAVILYDANALTCFKILKEKAPHIKRIMDTSAANRLYMKEIYEKDMRLCPQFAQKLKQERNFLWRSNYCSLLAQELKATQYFLAPSEFVKNSLMHSGIREDQIKLCPYGANFDIKPLKEDYSAENRTLNAVYVGNVTEMKGIYYLLEAVMGIPAEKLKLTVVGAFENDEALFGKYAQRVTFTGRVTHEKVEEILSESDIFVFPSLGEGMSLSVLEAMACGLPCVVSQNSGVTEAITDGENGFIMEVQNIQAIADALNWFTENPEKIASMRRHAVNAASKYSWDKYNRNISRILTDILN